MGLLSFLGRSPGLAAEPDGVWPSRRSKLAALVRDAELSREHGPVLVLAHFPSTLDEVEAAVGPLAEAGRSARQSTLRELLAAPRRGRVCIAATSELPTLVDRVSVDFDGRASLLVAERYPTPARDEAVRAVAASLPYPCRLRFFLSLDDEVVNRFGGERLRAVIAALGVGEDEEIAHPLITRAVAKAQRRIAAAARSDVDTASPADWFQLNLPISLSGR